MAGLSCDLEDILTGAGCKKRGALSVAYWTKCEGVDWAAIAASGVHWDATTELILDYIMVGGAVFKKLSFKKKLATYDFTFTSESDLYEILIAMTFEGKDAARRLALQKALACCCVVMHLFDNNGLERVVGMEYNSGGVTFDPEVTELEITRHLDTSGDFEGSVPRDELDVGGESLCAPLFATVTEANIPV